MRIKDILEDFADIEYDDIPGSCDGVMLRVGRAKPLVILQNDQALVRQRFTMAHELGHIVLPWHLGRAFCQEELGVAALEMSDVARKIETGANDFASGVLIPQTWLEEFLRSVESSNIAESIIEASNICDTSISATLAALRFLPGPPRLMLQYDQNGQRTIEWKTDSWRVNSDTMHITEAKDQLRRAEAQVSIKSASNGSYVLVATLEKESVMPSLDGVKRPNELLTKILKEVLGDQSARLHNIRQSVQGIVAAENGRDKSRPTEAKFQAFCQRFAGRAEFADLAEHPEFKKFLRLKAEQLSK